MRLALRRVSIDRFILNELGWHLIRSDGVLLQSDRKPKVIMFGPSHNPDHQRTHTYTNKP